MEALDLNLNFPDGPYPQDPPYRLPIAEYEALVVASIQCSQGSPQTRVRDETLEKYGAWEPFVYHED